jgi:hypothetical protein
MGNDIDKVEQEAELIAVSVGTILEQLQTQPVDNILAVLQGERKHNENETMSLIERFAGRGYIPQSYVEEARHLIFPRQ